jgi:class 3 adenylate cyclase
VRIGIDTGPVVAGVIGRAKFIYDLWGDTVNTASRMESHGLPGTIHVTPRAYDLLRERYEFRPRGTIEVKGKGPMQPYILIGRRATRACTPTSDTNSPQRDGLTNHDLAQRYRPEPPAASSERLSALSLEH